MLFFIFRPIIAADFFRMFIISALFLLYIPDFKQAVFFIHFYTLVLAGLAAFALGGKRSEESADYKRQGQSVPKGIHAQLYGHVESIIISVEQAQSDVPEHQSREQAAQGADAVKAGDKGG